LLTDTHQGILIVAKAPIPGQVKTRLTEKFSEIEAAELAAAALLDTLDTALSVASAPVVVALAGSLDNAIGGEDIGWRLRHTTVIAQRGNSFGERLHNAHRDADNAVHGAVFQVGMDTPQVTAGQFRAALAALDDADCVLGPATDGGWWGLGLHGARGAHTLCGVPMSSADTGAATRAALEAGGLRVTELPELSDVDHPEDIDGVACRCAPGSRFAATAAALMERSS
jgi:rSAM/selenodomain-associated transferase 1